jgi:hypothetical protein
MKDRQLQLQVEMIEEKIQRLRLQKDFYLKLLSNKKEEN